MKIALVSSWLWVNGEYIAPLASLDYVGLLARLREQRAAARDRVAAKALELEVEVDAATDWGKVAGVLSLCDDYERLELITSAGRFGLRLDGASAPPSSSNAQRTSVSLSKAGIEVWVLPAAPGDAAAGTGVQGEKLLELSRDAADEELEAEFRRVCSTAGRCSRVTLHFEDGVPGPELLRVLAPLDRATRTGAGVTFPAIALSSAPIPRAAAEASKIGMLRTAVGGRLPPVVIRQVVRASYATFRSCYERGLAKNPKLEGRVTVRFVIASDGSVSDTANGGSDLPDEEVVECVIRGFVGLRFPAPTGGIVTVQYPIMLQPG